MKIDCISDLHGHYPNLPGGDLLIVAGDLTARDTTECYDKFNEWLDNMDYKEKIVIAGNHDTKLSGYEPYLYSWVNYLCDSSTTFAGLKIYGSPWTVRFDGMNPDCMAFTVDTDEELSKKWSLIPDDVDILITHSPPYGIMDECGNGHVGSASLLRRINEIKPKAVFYGHIHEFGLRYTTENDILFVNASYVDERYKARNGYVRCQVQNTLFTASVIQEQKR